MLERDSRTASARAELGPAATGVANGSGRRRVWRCGTAFTTRSSRMVLRITRYADELGSVRPADGMAEKC